MSQPLPRLPRQERGSAVPVWSWLLSAAASLGCGRSTLNPSEAADGGVPSVQASGGAAPSSVASGGLTTGGTSADVPRDCSALIDDMEDGSGRICTGEGRVGVWYAFNEQPGSRQWPSPTPPGTPIETSLIPEGRAGSRRGMHSYGQASGWGAGIGVDLDFDGTTYRPYDASRYQGVHFWARGTAAGDTLRFRISTASTTAAQFGGTCPSSSGSAECKIGPTAVSLPLGPQWQEYTVSFAKLDHVQERDRLTNIQFMVKGDFDFWIDDVSFVEGSLNCCPSLPACQGGVHLTDAAVRSALLNVADPAALLDCGDVCVLRSVTLADPAIQSLDGFQCLSALEQLSIETSAVADLTPLSELTGLRELRVERSKVSLLRPLSALSNLRILRLSHNQIGEVSWLQGLAQLEQLDVSDNALTDIAPLAYLTALQTLSLGANQIRDASPVSQLAALLTLDLRNNRIDYLGQGFRLPALFDLNLSDNQVTDVNVLAGLSSLSKLYLDHNRVSEVSALAALTQLTELGLSNNSIETLNGAFAFRLLKLLDLSNNGLRLIPEFALAGSTMSGVALAHNGLTELNAFEHVSLAPSTDGGGGRNFGGKLIPAMLDLSDNQVQGLAPLLRARWQNVAILAADNPIDCALEASTIQSLRALNDSVDVCP